MILIILPTYLSSCDFSCNQCSGQGSNQCTSCPDHYFLDSGFCKSCSTSCKTCDGYENNDCKQCRDYFRKNAFGYCLPCSAQCRSCDWKGDCQSCDNGLYKNGDDCLNCLLQCATCVTNNLNSCTSCNIGYYLNNGNCNQCDSSCKVCQNLNNNCTLCHEGSSLDANNNCINQPSHCNSQCLTCSGPTCLSCFQTNFLLSNNCLRCFSQCKQCSNYAICTECYERSFLNNNNCQKCHRKCLTCNGNNDNNCLSCVPGFQLSGGQCNGCFVAGCRKCINTGFLKSDCLQCHQGQVLHGTLCCPQSCQSCTKVQGDNCLSCSQMYFFKDGVCLKCHFSCLTCSTQQYNKCKTCLAPRHFKSFHCCHGQCKFCSGYTRQQCVACQNQLVKRNGTCCNPSCLSCSGIQQNQCMTCQANKTLYNGICCGQKCLTCIGSQINECLSCVSPFHLQDGTCCHQNCKTCQGFSIDNCKSCDLPLQLSSQYTCCHSSCQTCTGTAANQCKTCLINLILAQNRCCHYSCLTCAGTLISDCSSCNNSLTMSNGYCCNNQCLTCIGQLKNECTSCDVGYHIVNGFCCNNQCLECLSNSRQDCTKCGTIYQLRSNHCCHQSCLTCTGLSMNQCSKCDSSINLYLNINQCCDISCADCQGTLKNNCILCFGSKALMDQGTGKGFCCLQEVCLTCDNPYTNLCTSCVSSYKFWQGYCCDQICNTCNGSTSQHCLSCQGKLFLYNTSCYQQCPSGTFQNQINNNCSACQIGCASCQSLQQCIVCLPQLVYDKQIKQCICKVGTYFKDHICNLCPFSCRICTQYSCSACQISFQLKQQSCLCPQGLYINNRKCQNCQSDCRICTSYSICLQYYKCKDCLEGCYQCTKSNICLVCFANYFFYEGICKNECPQRTYNQNVKCLACQKNCLQCTNVNCLKCQKGLLLSQGQCIDICPIDYFKNGQECIKCNKCFNIQSYYAPGYYRPYQIQIILELNIQLDTTYFNQIILIQGAIGSFTQQSKLIYKFINYCQQQSQYVSFHFNIPYQHLTFFNSGYQKIHHFQTKCSHTQQFMKSTLLHIQQLNDKLYRTSILYRTPLYIITPPTLHLIFSLEYSDKAISSIFLEPFLLMSVGHLPLRRQWDGKPIPQKMGSRILRYEEYNFWQIPGCALLIVFIFLLVLKIVLYCFVYFKIIKSTTLLLIVNMLLNYCAQIVVIISLSSLFIYFQSFNLKQIILTITTAIITFSYKLWYLYHSTTLSQLNYTNHWQLDQLLTSQLLLSKSSSSIQVKGFFHFLSTIPYTNYFYLSQFLKSMSLVFLSLNELVVLAVYCIITICNLIIIFWIKPYQKLWMNILYYIREILICCCIGFLVGSWIKYENNKSDLVITIFCVLSLLSLLSAILIDIIVILYQGYVLLSRNTKIMVLKKKKLFYLQLLVNKYTKRQSIDKAIVQANLNQISKNITQQIDYPILTILFNLQQPLLYFKQKVGYNKPHQYFSHNNFKLLKMVTYTITNQTIQQLKKQLRLYQAVEIQKIILYQTIYTSKYSYGQQLLLQTPNKARIYFTKLINYKLQNQIFLFKGFPHWANLFWDQKEGKPKSQSVVFKTLFTAPFF